MTRIFLVFAIGLPLVIGYVPSPAEACGVKLTVKAPRVRKKVKRSPNPSRVLLLGSPPRKLALRLSQAGHSVEVAEESEEARRKRYAVVVADPEQVNEARSTFPGSRVITRSSSTNTNLREVERTLARREVPEPRATTVAQTEPQPRRQARSSQPSPRPIQGTSRIVNQPEPQSQEKPPATASNQGTVEEPVQVAAVDPRPRTQEPRVERPLPRRRVSSSNAARVRFTSEYFFGTNSIRLSRRNRTRLAETIAWLNANPSVAVRVEGHTDVSGPAEYNKILSERRARAIHDFMVDAGIDSSRLEVISHGEERPIYPPLDRKNRRVQLVKAE